MGARTMLAMFADLAPSPALPRKGMEQELIKQKHIMAKKTVEIELVKTEASYRRALKQVSYFFDHPPEAGSALEAEFEVLMTMVERYEAEHYSAIAS